MNNTLLFDFIVNKENNTIHVTREFAANLELVWDAWTKPEIIDQWWGPKPWRAETKTMDFRKGGFWLYAMIGPQNEKHWSRADYKEIELQKSVSWLDAFCDEEGNVNPNFARSFWTNVFNEIKNTTTVNITIQYESLQALEQIIAMGFKEGFTIGLQQLDEYLSHKK